MEPDTRRSKYEFQEVATRDWIHDGLNVSFKGRRLSTGAGKKSLGLDMRAGGWRQGISNQIFYLDLVCLGFREFLCYYKGKLYNLYFEENVS